MSATWTVQMWSERSAVSASLAAACEQLGAQLVFRANAAEAPAAPEPSLLAALLPAGERLLPVELVRELDSHADLCLLLLCEEGLVRPTLSIQQGRIVLLEPPLTAARIEARLRLLVTARCAEASGSLSSGEPSRPPCSRPAPIEPAPGVPSEHYRTADYWFAVFMGAATARRRALSWRANERHGLSWALCDAALDDTSVRVWPPSPRRSAGDIETEHGLRAALGWDAALVQLDPGSREWRFLLPDDGSLLRVFSHQRLPRAWDAGRALAKSSSRFFRLAAAPGDVVCLMTASLSSLASTLERSALEGGGPALFQTLVTQCAPSGAELTAGVVVEVM